MSRSPNYMLSKDFNFSNGRTTVTLPQGSFVRPIAHEYLPSHITEKSDYKWMNKPDVKYCYTRWGIIAIDESYITEV